MTDWGFWIKVYIDRLNLHVKLIGEKAEGGSLTLAGKLDLDPSKKKPAVLIGKNCTRCGPVHSKGDMQYFLRSNRCYL